MKEIIKRAVEFIGEQKGTIEKSTAWQTQVWEGERPARLPLLFTDSRPPFPMPDFNTKEIHYDSEKMLLNGLRGAVCAAGGGMQAVPSVRANMGCGIFPTMFGIKQELYEDKMPWVLEHLDKETLQKIGPEDLSISGEFKAGLDHMSYMSEKLNGSGCRIFPMDLQGPFDLAHIVYGDAIFYDVYDDPDFVHHLLELSCQAIFIGMKECFRHIPGSETEVAHYNGLIMPRKMGGIKISEDTSTLLSGELIKEFVTPYTNKVLAHFGGGYIHYCGKNDHLYREVMDMPLAYGLNFGNPEKHDMDAVLKECASKGKVFYGRIPEHEGETLVTYFKRCINSATLNGKTYLLLAYSRDMSGKADRAEITSAWDEAAAIAAEGML